MTTLPLRSRVSLGTALVLMSTLGLVAALTAASPAVRPHDAATSVDRNFVVDLLPDALDPEMAAARQTPATGRVMRDKLAHSSRILEAIMTSDCALLQRERAELSRATTSPAWAVLLTPEYRRYSAEFSRVTEDLIDAAQRRDLDAAAMNYLSLTLNCYQCHRYVKGARIVR